MQVQSFLSLSSLEDHHTTCHCRKFRDWKGLCCSGFSLFSALLTSNMSLSLPALVTSSLQREVEASAVVEVTCSERSTIVSFVWDVTNKQRPVQAQLLVITQAVWRIIQGIAKYKIKNPHKPPATHWYGYIDLDETVSCLASKGLHWHAFIHHGSF